MSSSPVTLFSSRGKRLDDTLAGAVMPIVYVSRRLGRATDIAHLLEQGGCRVRLGLVPPEAPALTRFSPGDIARAFGDVAAIVVGTGEPISDEVVAGAPRLSVVCCYY